MQDPYEILAASLEALAVIAGRSQETPPRSFPGRVPSTGVTPRRRPHKVISRRKKTPTQGAAMPPDALDWFLIAFLALVMAGFAGLVSFLVFSAWRSAR